MKMEFLRFFSIIATFQAIYPANGSSVQLINNGYEDILIAVNPNIPENSKIIERIKNMVTAASPYMLQATKNRVYIRSVKILIPNTWAADSRFGRPKQESYDKADVIVAGPSQLGDTPYAWMYRACGKPGKYIHFTPNFLLNDNLLPIYGPQERVFAHEWAHLRWGVFDEYNDDQPYYLSKQKNIEATRCPLDLKGVNKVRVCQGSVCTFRDCNSDSKTGVYEAGCMFFPDVTQTANISVMYAQSLDPNPLLSDHVTVKSQLVKINNTSDRDTLKALLPTTARGGTNICLGVRAGFHENQKYDGGTNGTEVVLLTDGEDSGISSCFAEVQASGASIHTVALGPSADPALEKLAIMTGGLRFYASDALNTTGLIDAFSAMTFGSATLTQKSIQLESAATTILAGGCLNGTVAIDITVGNNTFFLVTWQNTFPNITLEDPKGNVYRNAHFVSNLVSKSASLEIPGTAERGLWVYSVCNSNEKAQAFGITVNSHAADANVPPITVETQMNADTNSYPNPMTVYAFVTQGHIPVLGAKVTAIIESQKGDVQMLELFDNGAGADIIKGDGIYSKFFFTFIENGRYSLKVRVENKENNSKLAAPSNRALYVPGYVANGKIIANPTQPPVIIEDQYILGKFTRTTSGGTFNISGVVSLPSKDIYKPQKITDLDAEILGNKILLSWTATGDDLDQGNASRYDLRMSFNFQELIDNFENATWVNISNLSPQPAGCNETFVFEPEKLVIKNGTIIYFGLVATDNVNQTSEMSNLARATLFLPPTPSPLSSPTQIPTPKSTPKPTSIQSTPTQKLTEKLAPTATLEPTASPTPSPKSTTKLTQMQTPQSTPTPKLKIIVTPFLTPTQTSYPTSTLKPTPTQSPTVTPRSTQKLTPTRSPTQNTNSTSKPTQIPTPIQYLIPIPKPTSNSTQKTLPTLTSTPTAKPKSTPKHTTKPTTKSSLKELPTLDLPDTLSIPQSGSDSFVKLNSIILLLAPVPKSTPKPTSTLSATPTPKSTILTPTPSPTIASKSTPKLTPTQTPQSMPNPNLKPNITLTPFLTPTINSTSKPTWTSSPTTIKTPRPTQKSTTPILLKLTPKTTPISTQSTKPTLKLTLKPASNSTQKPLLTLTSTSTAKQTTKQTSKPTTKSSAKLFATLTHLPDTLPSIQSGSDLSVNLNSIILFLVAGSTLLMTSLVL
ncbi:calcium-activated chloride channel regulator 3A-1-like [Bombina bombina]|uniref:calcium-activated chloride channel regulator 3A-1-like n=1 Tax=Bombina bombina TaxID=8345 RepID=UPI00235AA7B5|nr:calcium-activated chloride channel regulator 3A-1-like [Bombina bombina]